MAKMFNRSILRKIQSMRIFKTLPEIIDYPKAVPLSKDFRELFKIFDESLYLGRAKEYARREVQLRLRNLVATRKKIFQSLPEMNDHPRGLLSYEEFEELFQIFNESLLHGYTDEEARRKVSGQKEEMIGIRRKIFRNSPEMDKPRRAGTYPCFKKDFDVLCKFFKEYLSSGCTEAGAVQKVLMRKKVIEQEMSDVAEEERQYAVEAWRAKEALYYIW